MDSNQNEQQAKTSGSQEVMVMGNRKSVYQCDKRRIIKNVLVISTAWALLFTAYASLQNLQSSINRKDGLGTASLSVIYGSLVLSCMVIPPVMIRHLGCKWTIVVSMFGYIVYILANFKAEFYTIIPGSFFVGVSAAPLWAAKCTYLTELGVTYAQMSREPTEDVITRFFGIFFGFFQTSNIWGGIISSTILESPKANYSSLNISNCGINNCNIDDDGNENLNRPDDVKIYTLMGVYAGLAVIAVGLICFIDNLKLIDEENAPKFEPRQLLVTFMQMKNKYQLLLIPLTIFSGLEQGYFSSEYTKAFVSCTLGIWMVGFVLICSGICNAIGSYASGKLNAYIGRIPIFIAAACIHSGCMMGLMIWKPGNSNSEIPIFFVIAGLWGVGDSIWQTQINAFYGVVFPKNSDAAFANYRLWESVGFILAFGYSNYACVRVKTYIVWLALIIGFFCYAVTEYLIRRRKNCERKETELTETRVEEGSESISSRQL